MQFDRLAETVEKHFPQYAGMVQDARLFALGQREHVKDEQDSCISKWNPDEQVAENFRIPFDTVAIDTGDCCVCLKGTDPAKRTYKLIGYTGTKQSKLFYAANITAFPGQFVEDSGRLGKVVTVDNLEVWNGEGRGFEEIDFLKSELAITECVRESFIGKASTYAASCDGGIRISIDDGPMLAVREAAKIYGPKKLKQLTQQSISDLKYEMGLRRANLAFMECNFAVLAVLLICEPSTFIVETSEVGLKPRMPTAGKVIRSPYRPHFIVLTPGEIKRRYLYDESDPNGIPKAPHERRGHFRKLTSEKFKAKRNHILWIKACWVGKTEGVRGKNKYVVRIDL